MPIDSLSGSDNLKIDDFKNKLSVELSQKITESGLIVTKEAIEKIANDFTDALIDFKMDIALDENNMMILKGEVAWAPSRERSINAFSTKLNEIFKPIGGITPGEKSAFWSREGKVQAQLAGENLEKTIVGFLLEKIDNELTSTFTPKAHKDLSRGNDDFLDKPIIQSIKESPLSIATKMGLWNAVSKLYAQGTKGDAHIYLIDGSTSAQSVFWNTELQELQLKKQHGEIKDIFLHTLKEDKLTEYRSLFAEKKTMTEKYAQEYEQQKTTLADKKIPKTAADPILASIAASQEADVQILYKKTQAILTDPTNWKQSLLNKSNLKVQTSGFTGDRSKEPDAWYSTVHAGSRRWMEAAGIKIAPETTSSFRAVVEQLKREAEEKAAKKAEGDPPPPSLK